MLLQDLGCSKSASPSKRTDKLLIGRASEDEKLQVLKVTYKIFTGRSP